MDNDKLRELRYKWRGFAVVDNSFEDAGISLNADRIADWWLNQLSIREQELWDKIEGMKKYEEKDELKLQITPEFKIAYPVGYNQCASDIQLLLKLSKEK